jgi:uncharacterized protein (TIGR03067 family)
MIRIVCCMLLLSAVTALPDDIDPEPPKTAQEALKDWQGEWEFVKGDWEGLLTRKRRLPDPRLIIQKDQMIITNGRIAKGPAIAIDDRATIALNPRKKPAHIDISLPGQKEALKGIWKLNKGELTIILNEPGQARPQSFDEGVCQVVMKKCPAKE